MDEDIRALHLTILRYYDEKLLQDDKASIPEKFLRKIFTEKEFSAYLQQKSELTSTVIHPPPLLPLAEAYWKKCKQVIAASNRARTAQAQRDASVAAEKCQEAFEELPDEDKRLFEELSLEEWGLQYPQVEYPFPVPKNRVSIKPYTGTAKNAAQRFSILSALMRLEGAENNAPKVKALTTRPLGLRARED